MEGKCSPTQAQKNSALSGTVTSDDSYFSKLGVFKIIKCMSNIYSMMFYMQSSALSLSCCERLLSLSTMTCDILIRRRSCQYSERHSAQRCCCSLILGHDSADLH